MRASTLSIVLGAALLLGSCHKPLPPPTESHRYQGPPPGRSAPAACIAAGIIDGGRFVAERVRVLKSFAFLDNGYVNGHYVRPQYEPGPPPDPYFSDLADAFDAAPLYLAEALCNPSLVQWVFIDKANPTPFGWSYWEIRDPSLPEGGQADGTGRYIAVGSSLWNPQLVSLANFETGILEKLLKVEPGPVYREVTVSTRSDSSSGGRQDTLTLIAVLAREVGLMINFENRVATARICSGLPFQSFSWKPIHKFSEVGHIHLLGEENDPAFVQHRRPARRPSEIRQFFKDVFPVDTTAAADALAQIYGVKADRHRRDGDDRAATERQDLGRRTGAVEWADLLADATPDDDFVETYRMIALNDAGVTSLVVPFATNPPTSADAIANLTARNSPLTGKVTCVRTNFAGVAAGKPTPYPAPR
jgi:hypothetical protein